MGDYCKRFAQSAGLGTVWCLCWNPFLEWSISSNSGRWGIFWDHIWPLGESLGPFLESFLVPRGTFGDTVGTPFVFKHGMGRQRCPKRHLPQNSLTLLGICLDLKITKSRFQRHPKTSSGICPEKVFLKGVILRSSTCLNCVRGLKNQGFDVFRKGPKNEPTRHPCWHHF